MISNVDYLREELERRSNELSNSEIQSVQTEITIQKQLMDVTGSLGVWGVTEG